MYTESIQLLIKLVISVCQKIVAFFTEVFCEAPDAPSNAEAVQLGTVTSGGLYPYGSGFIYACLAGRRFEDGWTQKQITCIDDGIWSEVGLTCDCKSTTWNFTSSYGSSVQVQGI